jgi:hypothetical protein
VEFGKRLGEVIDGVLQLAADDAHAADDDCLGLVGGQVAQIRRRQLGVGGEGAAHVLAQRVLDRVELGVGRVVGGELRANV